MVDMRDFVYSDLDDNDKATVNLLTVRLERFAARLSGYNTADRYAVADQEFPEDSIYGMFFMEMVYIVCKKLPRGDFRPFQRAMRAVEEITDLLSGFEHLPDHIIAYLIENHALC